MVNIGEQVNKIVNEFLKDHGFTVRDETQQQMLIGQIKGLTEKNQPIITLMCEYICPLMWMMPLHLHIYQKDDAFGIFS